MKTRKGTQSVHTSPSSPSWILPKVIFSCKNYFKFGEEILTRTDQQILQVEDFQYVGFDLEQWPLLLVGGVA